MQQAKQTLTFENNELRNQNLLLQGNAERTGSETIRRQVESELEPILEEHKLLKKERTMLLREAEKAKL